MLDCGGCHGKADRRRPVRRDPAGRRGDVKETLRALLPRVAEKPDRAFLDQMLRRHRELVGRMRAYAGEVGGRRPIHPEHLAATLDELADDDAVFTVDTGMCTVGVIAMCGDGGFAMLMGDF